MEKPETTVRRQVFINCPFDSTYAPLFLALISGVVSVGCIPRCVLELPSGSRINRILSLIKECGTSVHDLSRVSLSRSGGSPVPRFNMPFEAGLAYAHSELTGGRHSFLVLEKEKHRLLRSLSDLNSIDPYIHHGKPAGISKIVLDTMVSDTAGFRPTMAAMTRVREGVADAMRQLKMAGEIDSYFERSAFKLATITATRLAQNEGLVSSEGSSGKRRGG